MLRISALLHTHDDELRLARALQTLLPCDEILIIDHGSTDSTRRIARQYGARIFAAADAVLTPSALVSHTWILALLPCECVSESLEAALFEWKHSPASRLGAIPFSVSVKEHNDQGCLALPPATRLVPHTWNLWDGPLPANHPSASVLAGELLRFSQP